MKKITIDKNDGIAEVIDRILAVEDTNIILVIPRGSVLAKSVSNFRLLAREAGSADKKVAVESVDEVIISLAGDAGIERADAALKHGPPVGGVSDIVARAPAGKPDDDADDEDDEEEADRKTNKKVKAVKLTVRGDADEESEDEDEDEGVASTAKEEKEEEKAKESFFSGDRFFKPREAARVNDEDESSGGSGKAIAWILGVFVALALAFYIATVFLGRAQVMINFTQTPWSYQNNFTASKAAAAIDPTTNTVPAQIFTTQKNITQLFPATGAGATVSVKAQGTITIYNSYSAAPQDLVAKTRFVTPDGKLFRLVNDVTVPGAQAAAGGKLTASSITAPIVADQGGPAYNVGPVAKLTIPGFQSAPAKYAGFYGAILGQTTGGFTGTRAIPTASDIASAKASTTAILEADLQDSLTASYPGNFKILDGATSVQITKLTVSTSTDQNGNFSVFGNATLQAIGFDESAFEAYLLAAATNGQASSTFKSWTPSYSSVQADFTKGQVSFAFSGQGVIEPAFSPTDFLSSIAGKSIGDARAAIEALPELSDGKISVWPVWLWDMPSNPNKIQLTAN